MNYKLAVLITCHNRKHKTLRCLESIDKLNAPKEVNIIEIFLVDDGSIDGTSEAIRENFSHVNIIQGTGDLYWNKGMRLAWNTAASQDSYDFYLWVNDDVVLGTNALIELLECYGQAYALYNKDSIIVGAFCTNFEKREFSYGGRLSDKNIIPNGKIQECKFINGNTVLIPKEIFLSIGNLSSDYTHSMGDYDYGLRATASGYRSISTKKFIGTCTPNKGLWHDQSIKLKKRLELFYSPRGLNYKEYVVFRKKFWKSKWILFSLKVYFRVLFPTMYNKIKTFL
jgi:GT2 family glycosyltransferase